MIFRSGFFILLVLTFLSFRSFGSDTLTLTLHQADSIFLANNYYLLAASMNVEAQKAKILQAKLYPNPTFTADINFYDPQNDKWFHAGKTGQKSFQLEQLITLSGKRKSEIELARINADIALLEFQDLVRQLKFRLHKNLFALGQQQQLLTKYNTQLALLDSLMSGYESQVRNGNMPLKDFIRLKSEYLELNNDRADVLKEYFEAQADIQTLLQASQTIVFRFSDNEISSYIKIKDLEELITSARTHHPYLQISRENKKLAHTYLRYQKQMAVPEINLFSYYDQRGGAFDNQINTGLSVPLPIWNRNQGNVKAAQYEIKEAEYQLNAREQELLANLRNSYQLYMHTVKEYQKASRLYDKDFELILKGVYDNFQKRNISLLEFVDFFEAYNEAVTELARIKTQLVTSAEQLNLNIGIDVY